MTHKGNLVQTIDGQVVFLSSFCSFSGTELLQMIVWAHCRLLNLESFSSLKRQVEVLSLSVVVSALDYEFETESDYLVVEDRSLWNSLLSIL